MARILCIDDFELYAEMVGAMLRQRGNHEVKVMIVPLVMKEIEAYKPDVVVLNLVRKPETISLGGLTDFATEVDGAQALFELAKRDGKRDYGLVVTALAVAERDLPAGLEYDGFVEVPQRLDYLLHTIERLQEARKQHSAVAKDT